MVILIHDGWPRWLEELFQPAVVVDVLFGIGQVPNFSPSSPKTTTAPG